MGKSVNLESLGAKYKEWVVFGAVALVACVLCVIFGIRMPNEQLKSLKNGVLEAKKRTELFQEIVNLKNQLADKEAGFQVSTDRAAILSSIYDAATQSGVTISTLNPKTESAEGYELVLVSLQGSGNFFSCLRFLKTLEKNQGPGTVKYLSFNKIRSEAIPEEAAGLLMIELRLATYMKQQAKKTYV